MENSATLKICHISDTHGINFFDKITLPEFDVLVHSGDLTNVGELYQIVELFEWFRNLHKPVVFVAGNHDRSFDQVFMREHGREDIYCQLKNLINDLPNNIYYLENQEIIINGIKFWGSPVTPDFFPQYWAFNKPRGKEISKIWNTIPEDTDVLITHGPPAEILDKTTDFVRTGCKDLRRIVTKIKPKLHLFGHIHEAFGSKKIGETIYSNGSIINKKYIITNQLKIFEI